MQIGLVIRKYRKEKGMTQEEMARRLGVTAPAVNKWENGNTTPDIALLAPIARLLGVSLDTLLNFQGDLSDQQLRSLIQQAESLLASQPYEAAFAWAKAQMTQYPQCDALTYSLTTMLRASCIKQGKQEQYDVFFERSYAGLLNSGETSVKTAAAQALYYSAIKKKQYEKAQQYLDFFAPQDPERKKNQAFLYQKMGRTQDALRAYEQLLFDSYQTLDGVFQHLAAAALEQEDFEKARYYVQKHQQLARLFEMGDYRVYACELELMQAQKDPAGTLRCARDMVEAVDTLGAFCSAPLYAHMAFRPIDRQYYEKIRQELILAFKSGEGLEYLQADDQWQQWICQL
jgi:transcriptional regulator with XRE-family HTH domain